MTMDVKNTPTREVEHYVDPTPFNPAVTEEMTAAEASQERLLAAAL